MEPQTAPSTTVTHSPASSAPPLVMMDQDAARYLSVSVHTLRKMRCHGTGPRYVKIGRCCRYQLSDLKAYIDKQAVTR